MFRNVFLALMTVSSVSANAGEHVWDFTNVKTSQVQNGNTLTYLSNGSYNVTASAWSSTGGGCGTVIGKVFDDKYSCIQNGKLHSFAGGLGVQNRFEHDNVPNHAIDNTNENNGNNYRYELDVDMVLLTFEHEVKLTGFGQGWQWHDADASVAAFTGDYFTNFGKSNWSSILSEGWSMVDNKTKANGGSLGAFGVADTNIFSKYWLVGAYTHAFSNTDWSDNNDAFKLSGITAIKRHNTTGGSEVNAPATLGIFAIFCLFVALRRK